MKITFFVSDFVAKTQNPSVHAPRFKQFMIPSLDDFVDVDRDKLMLCPIRILRKSQSRTEQYCLEISNLFAPTTKRKKRAS